MVTTQISRSRSIAEQETELHVAAFYEDLTTAEWAKEIFDRIRNRMPRDMHARPSLWRFDLLDDEHWEDLAIADASDAAVIIVATRGTRSLPQRLLDCVERALIKKNPMRIGLVAVLQHTDQIGKDSLPACRQLHALSRKAKLQFFSLPWGNLTPMRGNDSSPLAANSVASDSLSIEIGSYRAWGINE